MIGYDRPLKPEWIFKTLQLVQPGRKPEEYYDAYNSIAVELTGKDGRRKTRTVLFRTFIYSFQETTSIIQDNMLLNLCKQRDFEYMKPILLAKFIIDYEILRFFTQKFYQIFDPSQEVSSPAITAKMVESYGDTEIIKRSTRSFLKTLCDFKILEPVNSTKYHQLPKTDLTTEQIRDILKLYAIANHTKQIDIQNLDKSMFAFYQTPDLNKVAKENHTSEWEYISGVDRKLLILK
ncbi:MAG: hypothetical protein WBK46_06045 [Ruminococcus flavefaciens]